MAAVESMSCSASDLAQAVQDPDQIVRLLCQKFSELMDRVRVAEARHTEVRTRSVALQQEVRERASARQATSSQMQNALRTQLAEAEAAQQRLKEARAGTDFVATEVTRAKEAALATNMDCERLSSQCREEQKTLQETADQIQEEEAWYTRCERERQRLRAEVEAVMQRISSQEEDLAAGYERDRARRSGLRELETKLADAGRQRQVVEKRVQTMEEELVSAQTQVGLYQDRLESLQQKLLSAEEELQQEKLGLEASSRERLLLEQQEAVAKEGLEKLRSLKVQLEEALKENVEAHSQLKAATLAQQASEELCATLDARHKEALTRLSSAAEGTAAATADLERWQQRLQGLGDSVRQQRCVLQELEESSKGANTVSLSLQEELQRVFIVTEKLRQEREEVTIVTADIQSKLRNAESSLDAARRRTRELEAHVEDAQSETLRARQQKESLLLEVQQSREKMRGLRKRHTMLVEKVQNAEKRLLRAPAVAPGIAIERSRRHRKDPAVEVTQASQDVDLEQLKKQHKKACERAKKLATKMGGADDKKSADFDSDILLLTCFRCLHRYYDPSPKTHLGKREEWPVVALGAVWLSGKITNLPKRAKIMTKLHDGVANERNPDALIQDSTEKDHDQLVARMLGVESQMLYLLGFNFACEQWKLIMANALRFYMQLAETKDIGDVNTHLLDAVMVMAYKFYIKGAEFAESRLQKEFGSWENSDVFDLVVRSQADPADPASLASEGSPRDSEADRSDAKETEEDQKEKEEAKEAQKDGEAVKSEKVKLRLTKGETQKDPKDAKRDRPEDAANGREAKCRRTDRNKALIKEKMELVVAPAPAPSRAPEEQKEVAATPVATPEAESLAYLRQWVELEEARLGVARTPPKPSPAPSASQTGMRPAVSATSSSAALAALSAGADTREVLALFDNPPAPSTASSAPGA
eukprot:s1793_g16.t2